MGTLKTKGIVIAEHNMGDFDKMLTILTPGMGKISCAAKGARRPKSTLLAGSQLLCFGEYVLYKGTNTYNINSCDIIEVFYNIRTDLDKLKYTSHITKIIHDVTTENQNTYKILQLYLNTLYMISETDKNQDLILSIFKLKLMCYLGFTPKIDKCINCNSEEICFFSLRDSSVKCMNCGKQDTSSIEISQATFLAIKYIVLAPPKKLYSFNISEKSIKELEIISKLYANEKLEKEYKLEEIY